MIQKSFFLLLAVTLTLSASCQNEIDDMDMGSCYEKEGNINLSQAAYERALLYNSNNTEAKMRLAALYRKEGMDQEADALLATVDTHQLTPQQRTSLAALRSQESDTGTFRAQVTLDAGYDDNINVNHVYDTSASTSAQGTRFLRFNAALSYQYDLTDAKDWFLRSDANLYHQYNFDFESDILGSHYYDTLYGRLYAGGGYKKENFSIYVPLFYDRLNYLSVDLYTEIGLRPDFNMMFNKIFVLNINTYYSQRSYKQDPDKMRDDTILALESGFYWIDNRNNAYAKLRYEKYTPKDANAIPVGTKVFVDKALISLTLGGIYSIANTLDIRAQYLYRMGDFKEIPLFTDSLKRDDTTSDIQLSFEHELSKALRAHLQFHYLKNSSNYNQAVFTKKEALVGLVYNY